MFSGRADPGALLDAITRLRIDVACFQELRAPLAEAIGRVLPEVAFDPDPAGAALGIASRKPVAVERFPLSLRDGWAATLSPRDWPGFSRPVQIVNVHIMGPHAWPYFPRQLRRGVQLSDLFAFLEQDPDLPRAIVGDFNSSPAWPLYKRMASRYVDAAVACRNGLSPPPTWPHVPSLGVRGIIRIDHCFVSRLAPKDSGVVEIPGSDHLGLCVEIKMGEARA